MSKFVILASVVTVALISAACGETGGPSNSASSILTGPSSLVASTSDDATAVSTPTARAGGGGGGKPGGGKGGTGSTGGSGSLALVIVTDSNGNGFSNWGDSVRFDVSTTATSEPNVSLTCSQNGAVVYGAVTGYYSSYPWPWTQVMTLSSNTWTTGAASCIAKLYYISGTSTVDLASMSFTAGA
jgi:hypothetical protein